MVCAWYMKTVTSRTTTHRDMCGIRMAYAWHMHGMCMAYAWHVHGMCMACAWHVHGMCMAYAWHVHGMCMAYAWLAAHVLAEQQAATKGHSGVQVTTHHA